MTSAIGVLFDGSEPLPEQQLMPTGHDPLIIASEQALDEFVAGLIRDYGNHSASAYAVRSAEAQVEATEPCLEFAVNKDGKHGGLKFFDGETVHYARGVTSLQQPSYQFFGNTQDWPSDSVLTLETVKDAVDHFRTHGGAKSVSLDWAPWPSDLPL